jgi:hypothetical protein
MQVKFSAQSLIFSLQYQFVVSEISLPYPHFGSSDRCYLGSVYRSASSTVVYTPEQMSGILNDLVTAVQGIRLFLIGSQGQPTPPQPAAVTGPPWIPAFPIVPL